MKSIIVFYWKIFQFLEVKCSIYLNRCVFLMIRYHMSRAKRKCVFGACADSEGPDQSNQSPCCPLLESLDTIERSMEGKCLDETLRMRRMM